MSEIADAYEVVKKLSSLEIKPRLAVAFKKNQKALQTEYDVFIERRQALFDELGEKSGDQINIKPENLEEFQTRIKELTDEELEVEPVTIRLDDLEGQMNISGDDLLTLDWIIID